MKRVLAAALAVLAILAGIPLALMVVITMVTGAAGTCAAQAATAPTTAPTTGPPGTVDSQLGNLGDIDGPIGGPVPGTLGLAQANIPNRSGLSGFDASMPHVLSHGPDFVTLNEISGHSIAQIQAAAPGYLAYRAPEATGPGGEQSLGNAVLYKADTWTLVNAGQVKIVEDDQSFYDGQPVSWDRFAAWVMLQRKTDGVVVSVIATHQMINPAKYPAQHDNPPLTRAQQYGAGMDILVKLANSLAAHGPVLVGGDMNTHPTQIDQPWSAAAKMSAAGYGWYDHDIDFAFYQQAAGVRLAAGWTGPMVSDHQWISARLAMNNVGPVPLPTTSSPTSATGTAELPGPPVTGASAEPPNGLPGAGPPAGLPATDVMAALMQLRFAPGWPTLTAEQATNAITIAQVARDLQVPQYGLQIAIAAAIQESALVDLDHGDADSLGLFQQRPSQGWGTPAQITDPVEAAQAFFGRAEQTNNTGLLDIPGWEQMPLAQAAQAVQRSGAPEAYARWAQVAGDITDLLGGDLPALPTTTQTGNAACAPATTVGVVDPITVGTLNLLGASHTDAHPGGGSTAVGYPDWSTRLPGAMSALQDAGVSVAALQEVQPPQAAALAARYSAQWGIYPAPSTSPDSGGDTDGDTGGHSSQDRVIWDRNTWRLTAGRLVAVPYFTGRTAPTPLVELTSTTTGQSLWVWSVHNPADTRGDALAARTQALQVELDTLTDTAATGVPTVIAGDFNDAADGAAASQCVLTPTLTNAFSTPTSNLDSRDPSTSPPTGPSATTRPRCSPVPGDASVDHIYGTNLTWSTARIDHTTQTNKVSDHPLVVATTASTTAGCASTPSTPGTPGTPSAGAVAVSPVPPASSTSAGGTGCSEVVYPVPAGDIGTDEHNWHEEGPMWSHWHSGTDFGVPCGTPVYAAHGGTIEVDTNQAWAGPWLVKVNTGPTSLTTWYAHMEQVLVTPGQTVRAGQQIGLVGQEGNASGCHLHFEVHLQNSSIYGPDNVDPSAWLAQHAQT